MIGFELKFHQKKHPQGAEDSEKRAKGLFIHCFNPSGSTTSHNDWIMVFWTLAFNKAYQTSDGLFAVAFHNSYQHFAFKMFLLILVN